MIGTFKDTEIEIRQLKTEIEFLKKQVRMIQNGDKPVEIKEVKISEADSELSSAGSQVLHKLYHIFQKVKINTLEIVNKLTAPLIEVVNLTATNATITTLTSTTLTSTNVNVTNDINVGNDIIGGNNISAVNNIEGNYTGARTGFYALVGGTPYVGYSGTEVPLLDVGLQVMTLQYKDWSGNNQSANVGIAIMKSFHPGQVFRMGLRS